MRIAFALLFLAFVAVPSASTDAFAQSGCTGPNCPPPGGGGHECESKKDDKPVS